MVATFMNNIQLQIERVHVRYEDSESIPGLPVSAGFCLHSLVAETTNSKWKETQINGKAKTIYKLIRFNKFSVYWNSRDNRQGGEEEGGGKVGEGDGAKEEDHGADRFFYSSTQGFNSPEPICSNHQIARPHQTSPSNPSSHQHREGEEDPGAVRLQVRLQDQEAVPDSNP